MSEERSYGAALREARHALKKQRRALNRGRAAGPLAPDAAWFLDHAARFLSVLDAAELLPRTLQKDEKERLRSACARFVADDRSPTQREMGRFFSPMKLSFAACEALPAMLGAAAVCKLMRGFSPSRQSDGLAARCAAFLTALERLDRDSLPALLCEAERLLMQDPAGVYLHMSPETRARYRRAVQKLSLGSGYTEAAVAESLLCRCRAAEDGRDHVGFYLPLQKRVSAPLFFAAELASSAFFAGAASAFFVRALLRAWPFVGAAGGGLIAVCSFLLCFQLFFALLRPGWDRLLSVLCPPYFLPRLDEDAAGLPLPQTLITLSVLLPSAEKADALFDRLEDLWGAAGVAGTKVAVLADLPNADVQHVPTDAADIAAAKRVIDRLNAAHNGGFLLLLRERTFSLTEGCYTGRERKRGAIEALVKTIADGVDGFELIYGDREGLRQTAFLLTLDADTGLPYGALRRMLCTAAHPLNRAVVENGRVTAGYGCFSPRLSVSPEAADRTLFTRLMTGSDVSVYTPRVSERYMDLCGTGLFCGKGLIDVAAYRTVCTDVFPAGKILSHDMPEGALLSTAFVSDVVFSEDLPSRPSAWLRRAHRWLRGDVQNLLFLVHPSKKDPVALPALSRLQLLDNLRRALLPITVTLGLLLSAFLPGISGVLLLVLSVLGLTAADLAALLSALRALICAACSRRCFGPSPAALRRMLRQPALLLGLLPANAATHLDAICRALWRGLCSHKKTLEWTTAADAGAAAFSPLFTVAAPLLLAIALRFGPLPWKLLAALFALSVPLLLRAGRSTPEKKSRLSDGDRETLRCYAAAAWRYFDRYVTAETNHLPPDNVQESPVFRVAKRTSPTNIGLYLTSLLAAADLRFLTPADLQNRLDRTLSAVERLPKYRGLLYNWYDIVSLSPLPPAFVSSVDCGNFLVCLTSVREGLRAYTSLSPAFARLIDRLWALETAADLRFLYDPAKRCFAVGCDAETGALTEAAYTFYMSESRLCSYYAVARGLVPVSHWGALARAVDRRGAPVSFSGTAFEFLMPALFLPRFRSTYEARGRERCLRDQKRFALRRGVPMGVSESGYYAFDERLNYLYRAHGLVASAGGADVAEEAVCAPYAAFLLALENSAAGLRALSEFAALSAYGGCGFYEAVDLTRRASPEKRRVVRSYMAHHVGMSLLSVCSLLHDGSFIRRFMGDPSMRAARSLLMEAPPENRPLRRPKPEPGKRQRPHASRAAAGEAEAVSVFSNGESTLLCDETGRNRFVFAGEEVLNFTDRSGGVFLAVEVGGEVLPITERAVFSQQPTGRSAEMTVGTLHFDVALALAEGSGAFTLPFRVENRGKTAREATLLWYFEPGFYPTLQPPRHPAFDDMRLRARFDAAAETLLFTKITDGQEGAFLGVGFTDGAPLRFCCDRETVLGSDPLRRHPFARGVPLPSCDPRFTQPGTAIQCTLLAAPGKTETRTLLLVPGTDKESVLHKLSVLRRRPPTAKTAAGDLLRKEMLTAEAARRLLASVFFDEPSLAAATKGETVAGIRALWEAGVSGDLPLWRVAVDALPPAALEAVLHTHALLAAAGLPLDLALLTDRPAVYGVPLPSDLRLALKKLGISIAGGKGGRHLLRIPACSPALRAALKAAPGADYPCDENDLPPKAVRKKTAALPALPLFPKENHPIPGGWTVGMPTPRPWSHVMANRSFGTLLTNASLGFTWALNARLNPLTPWRNDVCSHFSGERLLLKSDGNVYDCVAGAAVSFTDEAVVYGAVCGEARLRITVRVDAVAMKKEVRVSYNAPAGKTLGFSYLLTPQLCENPFHAACVRFTAEENCVSFYNPSNADYPGRALLCCDHPAEVGVEGAALCLTAAPEAVQGELVFTLLFAARARGLSALQTLPFRRQTPLRYRPHTGNAALDRFAGSLLLHEVRTVRLLARTGFYQNSGAWGFRDQLQDAMNLAAFDPALTRTQLLRCAAALFPEGDALHWFHAVPAPSPHLLGARTRCADDRLWLPLAAAVYAEETGDDAVFDVRLPYLAGEPLCPEKRERCGTFFFGEMKENLFLHCMRAIRRTAGQTGRHGLPLLLGGDWNDGFSEAGIRGQGESVWLSMFLSYVCRRFLSVARRRNADADAAFLRETAERMEAAASDAGWNGAYFRRGFTDDGAPLGDPGDAACAMDLTVQAFATLAEIGSPAKRRQALEAAFQALYSEDPPLVRLLSPPFGPDTVRAGYINDYPPGVRENGGQYTHAAVWFLLALQKAGMAAEEEKVLRAVLPPQTEAELRRYKNEPYALTADVNVAPAFSGRGGWSQYTGAAGWLLTYCREREKDDARKREADFPFPEKKEGRPQ